MEVVHAEHVAEGTRIVGRRCGMAEELNIFKAIGAIEHDIDLRTGAGHWTASHPAAKIVQGINCLWQAMGYRQYMEARQKRELKRMVSCRIGKKVSTAKS